MTPWSEPVQKHPTMLSCGTSGQCPEGSACRKLIGGYGICVKLDKLDGSMASCESSKECPHGSMCVKMVGKYGICVLHK